MVTGQPVSIANLKLDNLSGINALLSLRHSSLVLRDFRPLLQRHLAHDPLGATKIWIYHIGRNSFNLLLPGVVSLQDVGEVCRRIAAELDSRINSRNVAEYYASFGLSIAPPHPADEDGRHSQPEGKHAGPHNHQFCCLPDDCGQPATHTDPLS